MSVPNHATGAHARDVRVRCASSVGEAGRWTPARLAAFAAQGIAIVQEDGEVELVIPGVSLAARLRAIDGTVNNVDAFVGAVAEAGNVFFAEGNVPPVSCRVRYLVNGRWGTGAGRLHRPIFHDHGVLHVPLAA